MVDKNSRYNNNERDYEMIERLANQVVIMNIYD